MAIATTQTQPHTGVAAFRGVAEGASNSVAMEQWDTAQACAALDALKQWHEKVAQQFRKYKVDGEKLKSMTDADAVARELRVPRAAVAAIAEYIKPLVATAQDQKGHSVEAPPAGVVPSKYVPDAADFAIQHRLGKGAFGDVRRAVHKPSGECVALKMFDKILVQETAAAAFIVREKKLLMLMHEPASTCPFVVQLHFAFQDERKFYLALTLATGGSLYQNLQAMPHKHFDVETARFYIAELMLAVQWIHSKCVVHRDVKAENAMLTADGHVMLTDLGLAKAWGEGDTDLCTTSIIGTPSYMAPEVIRESGHGVGCDFWALGILLFEMMVGHMPFQPTDEDDGVHTAFVNILMHPPSFPAEPRLPMEARALITALLAKNPEHRLGSDLTGGWGTVKSHPFFSGTPSAGIAGDPSRVLPVWGWEEAAARNTTPPRMPSTAASEPEQEDDRDPQDGSCLGFEAFVSHLHQ